MQEISEKISNWVRERIGFDGLLHFAFCAMLSCSIKYIVGDILAIVIICVIGMAKEIYDKKSNKGVAEIKDILCNFVGVLIGIL